MAVLGVPIPAVPPLATHVTRRDAAWVVEVLGELDLASAAALREVVLDAVAQAPAVVVGLDGCPFADCAGLGALGDAQRLARAHGIPLVLACRRGAPAAAALAVVAPDRFTVFGTVDAAVLAVGTWRP